LSACGGSAALDLLVSSRGGSAAAAQLSLLPGAVLLGTRRLQGSLGGA
jgi:hypothetical protein